MFFLAVCVLSEAAAVISSSRRECGISCGGPKRGTAEEISAWICASGLSQTESDQVLVVLVVPVVLVVLVVLVLSSSRRLRHRLAALLRGLFATRSSGTLPDTVHRVFPPTQRFVRSAFGATRGSHVRGGVCAAIGVIVFPSRLSERGCGEWFTHVWLCEVSEWRLVLGVKVCDGATTSPSRGGVTPETCVLGSGVSRLASFSCQCGQIGSGPSGFACIVCECIVWVCLAVCVLSEAAAVI